MQMMGNPMGIGANQMGTGTNPFMSGMGNQMRIGTNPLVGGGPIMSQVDKEN